jgi:uncharacterized protein (TIGR02246 family)
MTRLSKVALSFSLASVLTCIACGADADKDEAAIRQAVDSYVKAFNAGDAAAIAAHWCEDCECVTPEGVTLQGREAIKDAFESFLAENEAAKLEVEVAAIRIEGPDAAVEEGTSRVTVADQPASETTYVARYAKEGGAWKLKTIREALKAPSHYEHLKPLEWLIGEWVDADEAATIQTTCRWTKNRNFISRSFAVSIADRVDLEGTQVIGWDPDKKVIRSWMFDSDGGFGAGLWTQSGKRWTVKALRVLPDGRKGSAVNYLTQVNDDTFTLESTGREVDGEILPSIGPVTVTRKPQ